MTAAAPKVYIVVVNWNAWSHTVECLDSLLRADYPNYQIIVCDNGSTDGSVDWLCRWALGGVLPARPGGVPGRPAPQGRCTPVAHVLYDRETAEVGGTAESAHTPLILIQTGHNLGFAGANNVALRHILARDDFEYVWLLNNDTVVDREALTHLIAKVASDPDYGLCGSQLRFYTDPGIVQAMGGAVYDPWSATARHIGEGLPADEQTDPAAVERQLSYVIGASMLVSRHFLREVGLMSEDYFFYFEEIDWVKRARNRFKLGYAAKSVVYHKGTASLKPLSHGRTHRLVEFYYTRSRVRFTRLYYPAILPLLCLTLAILVVYRFLTGRTRDALTLWRALRDPATYSGRRVIASSAPESYA